ncbi:transcriptional regulator Spx [Enterococcus sp. BWR-S5]|uniref:transcriptional regulator Spx n=1 Tax=Enterococcus sp. BWR-S5 TaxID=2787714 RepID=UPI001922356B|nr:transcriptional regulator Spx [Enterococcus sp. BWR-S5]MBL1225927.1 transcriptional regulator Spx [Enterococcus sp. BWR-S5]
MIKVYTSPSSTSSRKAKKWFATHEIPFKEKNFFNEELTNDELRRMLQMTENGTEDILSKRSNIYRDYEDRISQFSTNELIELIKKEPSILRRPIILDDYRMQVGFNEDEIRVFLPRNIRKQELTHALLLTGL